MTQTAEIQNASDGTILQEVSDNVGWITLNREEALNSLNHEMIRALHRILMKWADDASIHAVVLQGKGRAFCAGGDVRDFYHKKKSGQTEEALTFFKEEYELNRFIKNYPKPYISLINGINMGGGLGISAHGSHRVVTENARLSMPETTIGFFPDVGGTYFLSKMEGQIGQYLGLTGAHIKAEDAYFVGLATHYVPADALLRLIEDLRQADLSEDAENQINSIIEAYQVPVPQSQYAAHSAIIQKAFSQNTVEGILKALQDDGTDFSQKTIQTLREKSPTSLKVFLEALKRCKDMDFKACMDQEWKLSQAFVRADDFAEGVRALLIDKDKNPQWTPPTLEQVSEKDVDAYFN